MQHLNLKGAKPTVDPCDRLWTPVIDFGPLIATVDPKVATVDPKVATATVDPKVATVDPTNQIKAVILNFRKKINNCGPKGSNCGHYKAN